MRKKLIIAFILIVCLLMSYTTVYGAEVFAKEQSLNYLKEKIESETKAYMLAPDGKSTSFDVEVIEVKRTTLPMEYRLRANSDEYVAYSATTKTKSDTSTLNNHGISASSALTMTWVDGPGINNKITNLTGYFVVGSGTFNQGKLFWGGRYTGPTFAPNSMIVGQNFNQNINYTSDDNLSGKLRADSIAYIISPTDGKTYQLTLQVSPTILD